MPVVRPLPGARGSVIAHSEQLDSCLRRQPHSEARPLATSFQANMGPENLNQNLIWARLLTQQLAATRAQMIGHMSMLNDQVALLRENVERMKVRGGRYQGASPLTATEVSAAPFLQLRRSV